MRDPIGRPGGLGMRVDQAIYTSLPRAGKDAVKTVQHLTCNDAGALKMGQAQYSALLTPEGTFIDDVLVYRLGPNHFMVVVNAANTAKAFDWIRTQAPTVGDAAVVDSSPRYALITSFESGPALDGWITSQLP